MKEYKLEDIIIGEESSFTVCITDEMMNAFTHYSGDINPLHTNKKYAESMGFNNCVVYGMLTASFYSTLIGVYLPGKYAIFQGLEKLTFNKPVFVGDTLTVEEKIVEKNESVCNIKVKAIIKNQKGEKVSSAVLFAGVLK